MRVVHITSNISIKSGIMSVLMNYYRNINREKIQFDFIYFDEREDTYEDEIKKLGGKIYKINTPKHPYKFRENLKNILINIECKKKIVHIHEVFLSLFFFDLKRITRIKRIIIHSHVTKFSDKKFNSLRNRVLGIGNNFISDTLCACSLDAGLKIFGKKFKKEGVIINNAIDLKKFYYNKELQKKLREKLGIENKYVIGHIGGFTPQKNHTFILDIFKEVLNQEQDSILILIGTGYLKERIKLKCQKLHIENNVIFLDLGKKNNVNEIMNIFDVFLFPSIYEGLGVVLVEAQATGIPCIFSDVIPKEVNILKENNKVLSLSLNKKYWAEELLKLNAQKIKRDNILIKEQIDRDGYNIETEIKKLEEFYLKDEK